MFHLRVSILRTGWIRMKQVPCPFDQPSLNCARECDIVMELLFTCVQSSHTAPLSSTRALNNVPSKYAAIQKIYTSIWIHFTQKGLIEEERQGTEVPSCQNPKRQVILLWWCKILAVQCFLQPLALQLWPLSEAVRQNFEFQYPTTSECFLAIFDVGYTVKMVFVE